MRKIIKGVNKEITEEIKWKAPSFNYKGEYLVTFNLRETKRIHLVFHNPMIPKVKSQILEGDYVDRRMTYFSRHEGYQGQKSRVSTDSETIGKIEHQVKFEENIMPQEYIEIRGARENNLKNVSLRIPKRKITIFTGVSGSGKSSIVFDTIATESQRLLNENFSMFVRNFLPKYSQPDADAIENLSMSIVVDQKRMGGGSHSTVGTITDINTILRMMFSRIGQPHVGPTNVFGFNDPQGMCPNCNGLGRKLDVDLDKFLDKSKSLNEGAILISRICRGQLGLE